jgi:hypothetical protein
VRSSFLREGRSDGTAATHPRLDELGDMTRANLLRPPMRLRPAPRASDAPKSNPWPQTPATPISYVTRRAVDRFAETYPRLDELKLGL